MSLSVRIILAVIPIWSLLSMTFCIEAWALPVPNIQIGVDNTDNPGTIVNSLQIMFLLTILTLAPSILIMMTSFTRILIVLSFLRQAIGVQQTPSTQILIGLTLFLTLFLMSPVWTEINDKALQPYLEQEISQEDAWDQAQMPVKSFMLKQVREKDLELFVNLSEPQETVSKENIQLQVVAPAFIISELKTAFQIGFLIYIPFLILDMVVASILLSMGMIMVPPALVSLPFKLMLFVMVDGWHLVVGSLVKSFG
ncbi:MAG: flagellar type III secretion system pore protein FliP [Nitrospinales bacterium]